MRGHFGKKFSQPCGPLLFYGGGGGGGGGVGGGCLGKHDPSVTTLETRWSRLI